MKKLPFFMGRIVFPGMIQQDGMTADRIWEEVVCDSLGDMGVFAEDLSAVAPELAEVLDAVKDETRRQGTRRALEGRGQKNTAAGEGSGKMSLVAFPDGRRFVDVNTDQELFDGLSLSDQMMMARKIIKERFAGKVVGIDNKAFVNGATAEEYNHLKRGGDQRAHEAKMRASTELDNLLDAGTNFRTAPDGRDGHVHKRAVGDFRYFDTVFKVAGEYYSGVINIMPVSKGLLLKAVTKIENITQDITDSYGENPKFRFLRDASMDSIPDSTQRSNPQDADGHKSRVTERENAMPAAWRQNAERIEQEGEDGKWQYPGITQRTDALERAVKGANTEKKVEAAYRSLRQHDATITAEIEAVQRGDEPDGSIFVFEKTTQSLHLYPRPHHKKRVRISHGPSALRLIIV